MQPSQLEQLLKFLLDTLEQGKDFTQTQAPQFVQELLRWKFYEAAFFVCLGIFLIFCGVLVGQFFARVSAETEEERRAAHWIPFLAGLAIGAMVIFANVYTMVEVKVAPRVVLVEMVRDLISTKR